MLDGRECRKARHRPRPHRVGGVSAGGGLSAATVLFARDRGTPEIAYQALLQPMLDDRNTTPSSIEFSGIGGWNRETNHAGWAALVGEGVGGADVPAYAAPARTDELSNLPPTLIQVGALEVFRDEAIAHAARLLQAGVATELHVYPGSFHGWDYFAPTAHATVRARDEQYHSLRRALQTAPADSVEEETRRPVPSNATVSSNS